MRKRLTADELRQAREDREEYAEAAYEMRANEIPVPSFADWKHQNAARGQLFAARDQGSSLAASCR